MTQRRDVQSCHVEPVVEILAEYSTFYISFKVTISGGEDAYIDRDLLSITDPDNFFILQYS